MAAVALRVTLILTTDHSNLMRADAYEYYRYALNLKICGVYSQSVEAILTACETRPQADSHRPPGFPLLLLPFVEWPPTLAMMRNIQWLQIALGALCVVLTFLTFRRLGPAIALASAFFVALSPHLVVASLNFLTENLFTLVLLLFLYAGSRWIEKPSLGGAAAIGVTLAFPLLVKSTTLYLVFLIVPFFAWTAKKQRISTAAVIVMAFLLGYGPWYALSSYVLPARAGPSLSLQSIHNGTYIDLMVEGNPDTRGEPHKHDPTYAERDSLRKVVENLYQRAIKNPGAYLRWYLIDKPKMYFSWDVVAGFGDVFVYPVRFNGYGSNYWLNLSHKIMWNLHWPLTILAGAACALVWLPKRGTSGRDKSSVCLMRFAALIVAYFVAVHVVGTPLSRYAVPIRPIVFALGCWIVVELFSSIHRYVVGKVI